MVHMASRRRVAQAQQKSEREGCGLNNRGNPPRPDDLRPRPPPPDEHFACTDDVLEWEKLRVDARAERRAAGLPVVDATRRERLHALRLLAAPDPVGLLEALNPAGLALVDSVVDELRRIDVARAMLRSIDRRRARR
jgi:hypothetical protein